MCIYILVWVICSQFFDCTSSTIKNLVSFCYLLLLLGCCFFCSSIFKSDHFITNQVYNVHLFFIYFFPGDHKIVCCYSCCHMSTSPCQWSLLQHFFSACLRSIYNYTCTFKNVKNKRASLQKSIPVGYNFVQIDNTKIHIKARSYMCSIGVDRQDVVVYKENMRV